MVPGGYGLPASAPASGRALAAAGALDWLSSRTRRARRSACCGRRRWRIMSAWPVFDAGSPACRRAPRSRPAPATTSPVMVDGVDGWRRRWRVSPRGAAGAGHEVDLAVGLQALDAASCAAPAGRAARRGRHGIGRSARGGAAGASPCSASAWPRQIDTALVAQVDLFQLVGGDVDRRVPSSAVALAVGRRGQQRAPAARAHGRRRRDSCAHAVQSHLVRSLSRRRKPEWARLFCSMRDLHAAR